MADLARVAALGNYGFLVFCILQGILTLIKLPVIWAVLMPFALIWFVKGVRATGLLSRLATEDPTSQQPEFK